MYRIGETVHFEGYASDYDRAIVAVEFSLDGGANWTRYDTTGATSERWVKWAFDYAPERPGCYLLKVRSVNDRGQASPTPDTYQFDVA